MNSHKYDENYYENGIKCGVSGYENYHYIPTRSYSEAITIHNLVPCTTCIDFGCAKGFLVHALNQLGHDTIGFDISEYAINNCLPRIKHKVRHLTGKLADTGYSTDLLIAKDVLEHIDDSQIISTLQDFRSVCEQALLVIPLGDDDTFRIREYEIDKTHITKKNEDYWIDKIRAAGFHLRQFSYSLGEIKRKWVDEYPYGNGFFIVENNG